VFDGHFDATGLAFITAEQADALRGVALLSNDILLNITGDGVTFARACLVPSAVLPACVNQHVCIVRVDPTKADPRYVLGYLTHPETKAYIESFNAGGSRRAITKGHIQSFVLPLPPLKEQRRIAAALGSLDALIETDRKQAVRLEALARVIAVTSPALAKLGAFAEAVPARQIAPRGAVEHYSLPAFDDGAEPELVDGDQIRSSKLPLSEACVLVSRLNPQWERCWMAYPGTNAFASTEFVPLIGVGAAAEEVWAVASAPEFWEQMRTHVTGTTGSHQRVDKAAVLTLTVPDVRALPELVRRQIVALVRSARHLREEIAALARSRDELLPLLMSGHVRVSEALVVA
jgi:type I restriction enzyme S subunit